ncbi:Leucine-rich repeat-containing protein 34, partial [Dufourea novaeangliae]
YNHVDELDIHNNYIMESGTKYLLKMGQDLKIKSLNFKANKFGIKASINLANFLLQNEHVLYLNVADVDQSISSLLYFITNLNQALEVCNVTLKCLDISRPNPGWMYNFDSAHFASVIGLMLKHNSTLLALHLQKYNFSCHDIENMMSNAIQNNTLHLLDLGCNNIGDHGVGQLAKWLTKRPALKSLILCRNIITDYGARELYCVIPFSKLLSLDISYNKITDEGMVEILYSLKKSPLLRQLRIFGNSIGHSAAKEVSFQSSVTVISNILRRDHLQDCKCCYCFRCAAPHFDEQCRDPNHPDTCNCCKCMGDESSDWSADKGITDRVKSPPDPLTKIQYILKRMSFEIGKNIMRWINIDEDVLEEDLKVITGKVDEDSSKDSCNCSWAQLSMSSLRKYLEETSSKNVLIIPKTSPLLKSLDNQASSSDDCTSTP